MDHQQQDEQYLKMLEVFKQENEIKLRAIQSREKSQDDFKSLAELSIKARITDNQDQRKHDSKNTSKLYILIGLIVVCSFGTVIALVVLGAKDLLQSIVTHGFALLAGGGAGYGIAKSNSGSEKSIDYVDNREIE